MVKIIIENEFTAWSAEPDNDYLQGAFKPVGREITASDLDCIGEIPTDLEGAYVRNGHNPMFAPASGRYHWFDGDSMVHGIWISKGSATYRNRMVLTAGLLAEMEKGRGLYPGLRDGFKAEDNLKNNSGTDIVFHSGEFKSMFSRCGQPYRLDPETLQTLGPDNFGGEWWNGISAHSKVDNQTGELIFFNYSFNTAPFMEYGVVNSKNKLVHSTPIELPGPRLPHDSWITENHTILHDFPLFWDPELLARGIKKLKFDASMPSRFGVIPRFGSGDAIRWFNFTSTYMLHTVNAWEDGDEILAYGFAQKSPVPDIPLATPKAKIQNYFLSFAYNEPRLTEYRINLVTGATSERCVSDECLEMPCINPNFLGRKSRFAYLTMVAKEPYFLMSGLQKWDFDAMATVASYELPAGKFMGQPVFAPREGAQAEDDGFLLAFVGDDQESEVYIWDAASISDGPVCRLQLPQRVPVGSHACWASGADMRAGSVMRVLEPEGSTSESGRRPQ